MLFTSRDGFLLGGETTLSATISIVSVDQSKTKHSAFTANIEVSIYVRINIFGYWSFHTVFVRIGRILECSAFAMPLASPV